MMNTHIPGSQMYFGNRLRWLIFKQNRRSQTPITTMLSLQIRTTHNNTLVQLHQHKHTPTGHGFVDGSRGGGAPAG